jgi:hypothetical protein
VQLRLVSLVKHVPRICEWHHRTTLPLSHPDPSRNSTRSQAGRLDTVFASVKEGEMGMRNKS